jgi:hypothetical protein
VDGWSEWERKEGGIHSDSTPHAFAETHPEPHPQERGIASWPVSSVKMLGDGITLLWYEKDPPCSVCLLTFSIIIKTCCYPDY